MPTKATQTNPSDVHLAGRLDAATKEMTAAGFVQVLGKCIRLSVPNVARTLKCHSFPVATGPYIAAIATANSALAAQADHIDNRVGGSGKIARLTGD